MKKLLLIFAFFISASFAQNFQLHYDVGEGREYFTSTIEMFKTDEYGSTFFFVDFDYNRGGNNSIALAYFEIARYINLGLDKFSATVQYNDGTAPWGPLGHIWLGGLSYPIDLGFVTLNTDLMVRKDHLSDGTDMQLTTVWYVPLFDGKLVFNGFLDLWTAKYGRFNDDRKFVLLTEPQIWYNIDKHLAIGGECEISKNFLPTDDLEFKPTLAVKWNF